MKEKIAILFDVQNLYHSSIKCGGKISYKILKDKIAEGREVIFARAYAAYKEEKEVSNFYKALRDADIDVMSKRLKQIKNVVRAQFDVEITSDAETQDSEVSTVVLCTGSGNFTYLAQSLKEQGIKVEVWSFNENTSDQLKANAKFVEIPKECLLMKAEA